MIPKHDQLSVIVQHDLLEVAGTVISHYPEPNDFFKIEVSGKRKNPEHSIFEKKNSNRLKLKTLAAMLSLIVSNILRNMSHEHSPHDLWRNIVEHSVVSYCFPSSMFVPLLTDLFFQPSLCRQFQKRNKQRVKPGLSKLSRRMTIPYTETSGKSSQIHHPRNTATADMLPTEKGSSKDRGYSR